MPAAVTEVACWAHVRRYFFDVHHQNGSPIAKEALDKIGALFDIERLIAGQARGPRSSYAHSLSTANSRATS
jgi:hypothetical protein